VDIFALLNIYTLYLQILSTKEALLMEVARVGRSSQEGWGDLSEGVGRSILGGGEIYLRGWGGIPFGGHADFFSAPGLTA
jgi:hypothetical protein